MADRLDFARIADAVLARAHTLVPQWLPGGRREGHEWRCGSIRGEAGKSFAVNLTTGAWADFAGDSDRGGDLISLYAAIFTDSDQGRAARELANTLSITIEQVSSSPKSARKPEAKRTPWAPVLPVPADAPVPPAAHSVRGRPEMRWEYRNQAGDLLGLVYRFRTSDGGKEVLPCVWAKDSVRGISEWRWLSFPEPRPLYGLQYLRDGKAILVVEGEKCVDAARAELSEWFDVVSWPGGGKAVDKADWTPLRGRKVVIWADCDSKREKGSAPEHERAYLPESRQPGIQAAQAVAAQAMAQGCMVRLVAIPAVGEKPDGWDIADAIAEGCTGRALFDWITGRLREPATESDSSEVLSAAPVVASPLGRAGAGREDWTRRLLKKPRGGFEDCKENVALVLEDHPELQGTVAFNEFSGRIEKRRDPPWPARAGEWTEDDDRELGMWLGMTCDLLLRATRTVGEGVQIVANRNRHHPVREFLQSLTWDGKDRNSTWLHDCLGVDQNDYSALVGNLWLRQAVNRILHPGAKGDYALILEGPQGLRKSTALKRLGGEWFSDAPLDLNNKDAMMSIEGVWIYEIAELDAFNRAESTRIKAFMTMTEDRYRPPYGSRFITRPRQTVFAATTNNDEYHKDPTGNRRFWSVLCRRVNLDLIDAQREQMFAQAVEEVLEGKPCYPTRGEEMRLVAPEQEKREIVDPWVELIIQWLNDPERAFKKEFSTTEILKGAIQMAPDRMDGQRSAATRVGNCMKKLAWAKRRGQANGQRPWVYARPESASPGGSATNRGGNASPL